MSAVTPAKMQAPKDTATATIDGHPYEVDSKGQVKVAVQQHVAELRRHGFTDVAETTETAEDIRAMGREELTEFIEERGGEVKANIKPRDLKIQALNAAGFVKEAKALAKKDK
jgi:hypothetical protein